MIDVIIEDIAAAVPGEAPGDYTGPNGLLYCGKCRTPKQSRVTILGTERIMPCICHCEAEARRREDEQFHRWQREEAIKVLRQAAFPDLQHSDWRFETDDQKNPELSEALVRYAEKWDDMRRENLGLLLYGPVGTGKTFFAACIANALIDRGIPALMTSFNRVVNTAMGMYEGRQEYLDRVTGIPLLILDDLGAERDSEYMQEQVYNIVDARYRAGKPLIVTTNIDLEEIKNPRTQQYKRIYDRILEMCHPVEVPGTSRRRAAVKENYLRRKRLLGL